MVSPFQPFLQGCNTVIDSPFSSVEKPAKASISLLQSQSSLDGSGNQCEDSDKFYYIYINYIFWGWGNDHRMSMRTCWNSYDLNFSQSSINQLTSVSLYWGGYNVSWDLPESAWIQNQCLVDSRKSDGFLSLSIQLPLKKVIGPYGEGKANSKTFILSRPLIRGTRLSLHSWTPRSANWLKPRNRFMGQDSLLP